MKTTDEMIAVMTAYSQGKKIEYKVNGYEHWAQWKLQEEPLWDWERYDYRIKPEPKYRPYKNAEECFADVRKHGGWVKLCNGSRYILIAHIYDAISFSRWLTNYVWADDGSPCGVLEN